jgi:uncharacterized protein (TIGR00251 family)
MPMSKAPAKGDQPEARLGIIYLPFTLPALLFLRVIQYSEKDRGLTFAVRIVPRASRSEIAGEYNGALRIRIAAPPVEGAANRELVRLLARLFKLPQNSVAIVSGAGSKNKTVHITGADSATLEHLILK